MTENEWVTVNTESLSEVEKWKQHNHNIEENTHFDLMDVIVLSLLSSDYVKV